MSEWLKDGVHYIYAEYNPYWIYMGWWLYAIPVVEVSEDKKIEEWAQATWLNYDWRLDALFKGIALGSIDNFRNPTYRTLIPSPYDYSRAFFHKYPAGVVCEVKGDGREFIKQESENLGDYSRRVRERQLAHIAKEQKENEA